VLHVSRPFLIKLLDEGKLPYRKVGTHRRIRYDDLRAYMERENAARRDILRELAAHDQEIGL
jgi:excisionase family DNA binding protein